MSILLSNQAVCIELDPSFGYDHLKLAEIMGQCGAILDKVVEYAKKENLSPLIEHLECSGCVVTGPPVTMFKPLVNIKVLRTNEEVNIYPDERIAIVDDQEITFLKC